MPRLITLSRAARLVGIKRGALQKRIQAGELRTFEGELLLSDLLHAYPQTSVEDTSMIERVEQIMEQAVNKIIRPVEDTPDTLAARILVLAQELGKARQQARRYKALADGLQKKFDELSPTDDRTQAQAFSTLRKWFLQVLETMETPEEESGIIAKEAFLRVMAAQVRILPSGHEFFIEGTDSILEAGLRGGLALNYGCSNGNCGLCKCKVVSGQVKKIKLHDYVLTETEKGLGYILACSNTAVTDVVLEADEALGSRDIPAQTIDIKVKKIEQPNEQIILVHAKTPRTSRLRFLAGQYLSLEIEGLPPQDCSIASCPCDDMNLQFHIPNISGNGFCEALLNSTRPNSCISIHGPLGDFTLNEDSPRSLVFIAVNAGFGPIKSLIEHAMALDTAEKISLYWITTPGNSHYLGNLCRSWDDALDNFSYTAMKATDTRAVEQLLPDIINDLGDVADLDYYVCLPGPLLATAKTFLLDSGIPAPQLQLESLRQQPSK
jgi:CDP-4-dehydro-6-deoxyglucose reductase